MMASDIATSSVLGEGSPDNEYVNSELVGKPICLDSDEDDEPATSETPKPAARNPKGRIRGKTKPDRSEPVKPPNVDQLMKQVINKTHIDVADATRNASIQASKKDAPRQDAPRQDEGVPSKGAGEPSKGDVSQGEVAGESEPSKGGDSKGEDAEASKGGDAKGEVPVEKKRWVIGGRTSMKRPGIMLIRSNWISFRIICCHPKGNHMDSHLTH